MRLITRRKAIGGIIRAACMPSILLHASAKAQDDDWWRSASEGVAASGGSLPNPILWYKTTEGSGTTTADASGSGNTGNLGTGATWVTGPGGTAQGIQSDNIHHSIASNSTVAYAANKLTMCLWAKIGAYPASGSAVILSTQNSSSDGNPVGGIISLDQFGNIYGQVFGLFDLNYVFITGPSAPSGWHHIAVTVDNSVSNGAVQFYFDNVLQTGTVRNTGVTGPGNFVTAILTTAAYNTADASKANCAVADIRLFTSVLTSGNVSTVFNNPT